jgi:hypothetical protein
VELSHFPYVKYQPVGNWIITDIDDLIGGKQWFDPR